MEFWGIFSEVVSVRMCECVGVYANACEGYSCVLMGICLGVSEGANTTHCFNRM